MNAGKHNQSGFSLLECMFAMVITVIGLSAVLGLVVSAINLHSFSRNRNDAKEVSKAKVEEIRNYAPGSAERARGGSLNSNVANYNDSPESRFRRRWLIEDFPTDAGVPEGTQRITVTTLSDRSDVLLQATQLQVLIPNS
ncbi:MAG: prepilin-type N-terminal cleavage/methylation domain-containing protein [Pyrinomonadaceae bacterium]|nr:prepilin-type N-terminal cleavage/methylation domain-containing protein [Pyrinomonadaceae bacterium]